MYITIKWRRAIRSAIIRRPYLVRRCNCFFIASSNPLCAVIIAVYCSSPYIAAAHVLDFSSETAPFGRPSCRREATQRRTTPLTTSRRGLFALQLVAFLRVSCIRNVIMRSLC